MSQFAVENARNQGNVRAKAGAAFLGISESTFWRWVAQGRLPKGNRLSARCTVWPLETLKAFVQKAAGGDA